MNKKETFPFSDRELSEAAAQVAEAMLSALPEDSGQPHDFSAAFTEKMDALREKDRVRRTWRRAVRTVAAVLAVVLCLSGVWLATDTEARADFRRWFRTVTGEETRYSHYGTDHGEALPELSLDWLPEDYVYQESIPERYSLRLVYRSVRDRTWLFLVYGFMDENVSYTVTSPEWVQVPMSGGTADFYPGENGGSSVLVWFDEELGIDLSLQANRDLETMLKIAEGVRLAEN